MQRHRINRSAPNTFSVINSISRTLSSAFTKRFPPEYFGLSDENVHINTHLGVSKLNKNQTGRNVTRYNIPNVVGITNPPWFYVEPETSFDQRDTKLGEPTAYQVDSLYPLHEEPGVLHNEQCIFYDKETDVKLFVKYYTVKITLNIEIMFPNAHEQINTMMEILNNVRINVPTPFPMYAEGEVPTALMQVLKQFKDHINGSELTPAEFTEYLVTNSGNVISAKQTKKEKLVEEYYQYYEHRESLYTVESTPQSGEPERTGDTFGKAPITFSVVTEQPIPSSYTLSYPTDISGLITPDKVAALETLKIDDLDQRVDRVVTLNKELIYKFMEDDYVPFFKEEFFCDNQAIYELPLPVIVGKEHIIAMRYLKKHGRDISDFYKIMIFENDRPLPSRTVYHEEQNAGNREWFLDLDTLSLKLSNTVITASYTIIVYYHKRSAPDLIRAMRSYYKKHEQSLQNQIDDQNG